MPVITQSAAVYERYNGTVYVNQTVTGQPYRDYAGGVTKGPKTVKDRHGNRPMGPYSRWVDNYDAFSGNKTVQTTANQSYFASRTGALEATGNGGNSLFLRFPQTVRDSSSWTNVDALGNKCVIDALNKLRDVQVNVPMMWAERQKTADLFTKGVGAIARSYRDFRRGKWRNAARHLGISIKKQPSNWLAYSYGVKPIMQDIYNAAELLSSYEQEDEEAYVVTVRATAKDGRKYSLVYNPAADFHHYGIDYIEESRCKVVLRYKPGNGTVRKLSSFGLLNPALLGWELIPFSFVVDWAFPMGDYLSALDATAGWNFHSGCRTYVRRRSGKHWAKSKVYNGLRFDAALTPGLKHYRMYMDRIVYPSSPLPKMPPFKSPASVSHVASTLALIHELFLSGGKK